VKASTKAKRDASDDPAKPAGDDDAVEVALVDDKTDAPDASGTGDSAKSASPKKEDKKEKKDDKPPSDLKLIRLAEDRTLREWMETLGTEGAYKIQISRSSPSVAWDAATRRNVAVKGHLATVTDLDNIDEEYLQREFGGGTFRLKVTRPGNAQYAAHRTVEIAGEPRLDRLPSSSPPPVPAAVGPAHGSGDSPGVVTEALKMVKDAYADRDRSPKGMDPVVQMMFEQMRAQAESQSRELSALRSELAAERTRKPDTDPFRDKLMSSMFEGESATTARLREAHAAEIRTLKEGFAQERAQIEARHDRVISDMNAAHARAIDNYKSSFEREIKAMESSHKVALDSASTTASVLKASLESEVRRLERENTEARAELKELRASAKDEKDILSQLKKVKELKEMISGDEDGKESSTLSEIAQMVPAVIEGVGTIMSNRGGQVAPPQAQAQAAPRAPRPQFAPGQMVHDPRTGQLMKAGPDGALRPVRKKPKEITTDDGRQVQAPVVDPENAKKLVAYLEAAFNGNTEPAVVVRSAGAVIPADIIQWIRDNDTEQTSGVDLFMRRVVNLPSNSPLASQAGRKWLRDLGRALIDGT
jgi:hypothetical protein